MQVKIRNFRGCSNATLPLQGLTLVAAHNGQGKTSIAQAVAAVLCGQWQPAGIDLKKKEAESLVLNGESKAVITVSDQGGTASLSYPSCEYVTDGESPPSSYPLLTGQLNFINMTTAQRVLHLLESTGMMPTLDDIIAAFPNMEQGNRQKLWKRIIDTSWDETCKLYKDQATALKTEWRVITGEAWGSAKANGWQPSDLNNSDAVQPESVFRDQYLALMQQVRDADIANSRIGILREGDEQKAAMVTSLEKQLAEIDARLDSAGKKWNEAIAEEKKAEKWISTGWACPHCAGKIAIDQGPSGAPDKVRKADELTPEQIEERNLKFSQIQQKKVSMKAAYDQAAQERVPVLNVYREAKEALKRISENQDGSKIDTAPLIEAATKALKTADLIKQYHAATEIQDKIQRSLNIAAYLDADGDLSIRKQKVSKGLERYNALLAELCQISGYRKVFVEEDLSVTYDGRRYEFLSASEQYRVRVILQVAEKNDGDLPLVFDAIDILDNAGRNGLIKLLRSKVKNALLTATILKREEAPDLSKVGGKTLWLENGTVA